MPGGKKWGLNKGLFLQLADAAITGTAENIKELLDAGADPDAPDGFYGLTALIIYVAHTCEFIRELAT